MRNVELIKSLGLTFPEIQRLQAQTDKIFALEKGRIVEEGNHLALLERRGLYYAMWRQQIGERPGGQHSSDASED